MTSWTSAHITAKPAFEPTIRFADAEATQKQMDYITSLGHQREIGMTPAEFDVMIGALKEAGACTKGWVSERIEEYTSLPKREVAAVKAAEPGYYTLDGDFYVVVKTKDGARTYAKKLVSEGRTHKWEYAPGMGRRMASMTPLSLDEAAKFGHLHGKCLICLRALVDPESVKAGIGPTCAKKVKK
jgi:hypothetical protein